MSRFQSQPSNNTEISIVVARAKNGIIGSNNQLPWSLPADLRHFKKITMGNPIIMGRKTHQSIGRTLPGRHNIVVTTDTNYPAPGCDVVDSIDSALQLAQKTRPTKICIIGGGQIYQQALPRATRIYLTEVDAEPIGDIYFNFDPKDWRQVRTESHLADSENSFNYQFIELERLTNLI